MTALAPFRLSIVNGGAATPLLQGGGVSRRDGVVVIMLAIKKLGPPPLPLLPGGGEWLRRHSRRLRTLQWTHSICLAGQRLTH